MHSVTLPPKKIIYERFYNLGWKHFLKKTKIHKTLGFKHEYAGPIVRKIGSAIKIYNEKYAESSPVKYKKYSTKPLTAQDQKDMVFALFKYLPEVIAFVEDNDVLSQG